MVKALYGYQKRMKVPHCIDCKFHIYTTFYIAKNKHYCKYGEKKLITAAEAKTSPKWCPLRKQEC